MTRREQMHQDIDRLWEDPDENDVFIDGIESTLRLCLKVSGPPSASEDD